MNRRQFVAGLAAVPFADAAARAIDVRAALPSGDAPERAIGERVPVAERPICIFSKHLQFLDYAVMAETAAAIGFDGVDLTVRPGGHVLPENVERDLPRAVEAIRQAGLEAPSMTTAIAYVDDPHAETVLRTAAAQGIRYYRMNWVRYDDGADIRGTIEAYRPHLERLAALNEELGLHGGYQNHAGTWVGAPVWDLHLLLEGLDPQFAGSQYDVRHATVEGAYTWPLGMKLIAPYIRTTVIKDFEWEERDGHWVVENVPLGEGMVDFETYFGLVRELEISGPISLHFEYEMPEHGDLDRRTMETAVIMKRDLDRLRGYLTNAGL